MNAGDAELLLLPSSRRASAASCSQTPGTNYVLNPGFETVSTDTTSSDWDLFGRSSTQTNNVYSYTGSCHSGFTDSCNAL